MPKSSKQKKQKAVDFTKTKLKLGKGKKAASNAIDTSFKARSIALPLQSIAVDKDTCVPTTKRRLTIDDLLAHTRHFNANTRKDAILGLRELADAHWETITQSLTPLISSCVRLIGDEDASVRKALLAFFSWLLPRIPSKDLRPHASVLLLFTTSAQTHIFPEIRVDAIKFLNILLDCIPESTVSGWSDRTNNGHGYRVLVGYLGLLSSGTQFDDKDGAPIATSTASVVLSTTSKLLVLQSLISFLKHALQTSHNHSPSPATPSILQPSDHKRPPRSWDSDITPGTWADPYFSFAGSSTASWDLQTLSEAGEFREDASKVSGNVSTLFVLVKTLKSTLISTFLDYGPEVFAPSGSPPETETQLVLVVVEIARCLYGAVLRETVGGECTTATEDLAALVGRMSPFFPFRVQGRRDIKVEQAFEDLNMSFCELTSMLLGTISPEQSSAIKAKSVIHIQRVRQYVLEVLDGGETSGSRLARPMTSTAYASLIPTLSSLIEHDLSNEMLNATLDHGMRVTSKSSAKRPTIEFISGLLLRPRGCASLKHVENIDAWITHLPQVLWELGVSNLKTTELILNVLLRLLQLQGGSGGLKNISSLQSRFIPYFSMQHPTRGLILGPFAKLMPPTKRLVLDVVGVMLMTSPFGDLAVATTLSVEGTDEQQYWHHLKSSLL